MLAAALRRPPTATPWRPDTEAAKEYSATRLGEISFAVRTERHLYGVDVRRTVPSASVLKAMLLVAYLREPDVRDRALRKADRDLLAPMIRWSDNVAATRVRDIVGNDGLVRLARRVGMRAFSPARDLGPVAHRRGRPDAASSWISIASSHAATAPPRCDC